MLITDKKKLKGMSKDQIKEQEEKIIRQVIEQKMDIRGVYAKPTYRYVRPLFAVLMWNFLGFQNSYKLLSILPYRSGDSRYIYIFSAGLIPDNFYGHFAPSYLIAHKFHVSRNWVNPDRELQAIVAYIYWIGYCTIWWQESLAFTVNGAKWEVNFSFFFCTVFTTTDFVRHGAWCIVHYGTWKPSIGFNNDISITTLPSPYLTCLLS